jgi:hypothetical protein
LEGDADRSKEINIADSCGVFGLLQGDRCVHGDPSIVRLPRPGSRPNQGAAVRRPSPVPQAARAFASPVRGRGACGRLLNWNGEVGTG